MKRSSPLIVSFIVLFIAVAASAQTWQGPTTPPPPTGTNVPPPLHVGGTTQTKQGGLILVGNLTAQDLQGNQLCLKKVDGTYDCKNAWSQVAGTMPTLVQVLQAGADASASALRVSLGDDLALTDGKSILVNKAGGSRLYTGNWNQTTSTWDPLAFSILGANSRLSIGTEVAPTHTLEVVSPMYAFRAGNANSWFRVITGGNSRLSLGDGAAHEAGYIAGGHNTTGQNVITIAGCDDAGNCPGSTTFHQNGSVIFGSNVGIGPQATSPSDLLLVARDDNSTTGIKIANINTDANATRSLVFWGGSNDNYAAIQARSALMPAPLSRALQITVNQGAGSKVAFTVAGANRAILDDTGKLSVLTAGSTVTTGKLCFSTDGTTPAANCMTSVSSGGLTQATADVRYVQQQSGTVTGPLTVGSNTTQRDVTFLSSAETGARFFWDASKYALRAGTATGTEWSDANIGMGTVAMGYNAKASGTWSVALGQGTNASGAQSAAIGQLATASGYRSTALGSGTNATGQNSTAMGVSTWAQGNNSTAMGMYANAAQDRTFIIGLLGTPCSTTSAGQFKVCGDQVVTGTKLFEIPHPDPAKKGWYLRHASVESPTAGDDLYRWTVSVQNKRSIIILPDYYRYLNENDMIWVSPVGHFGSAYGGVDDVQKTITIHADTDGLYNVLLIGTRKDTSAKEGWKGPEIQPER